MKLLFFPVLVFTICFLSCKKENYKSFSLNPVQQIDTAKLTDSCSFTIDGNVFILDQIIAGGKGNSGANLDTTTRKFDSDTIQYQVSYKLVSSHPQTISNNNKLTVYFVKKICKNDLIRNVGFGIMGPVSDTTLYYPKGQHPYAVDFDRFNSQNGIVLNLSAPSINQTDALISYINQSAYWQSSLNNNCQADSKFEITYIYNLPNGAHLLEAKFTANLFDRNEKLKKLENGYLRIHVDH
jgi:hypothetical protein